MPAFKDAVKLFSLIQDKKATYTELIECIFGESSPIDDNFLEKTGVDLISKTITSPRYAHNSAYKENPTAAAKIAFLIQCPFHFYIYRNIYKHLPESEFVIDAFWLRRNVKSWQKQLSDFTDFLNKEKVFYRIFSTDKNPEEFFKKYEVVASHVLGNVLHWHALEKIKKVRIMYGHSKDLWNFGAWSRHFDLALTYGDYSNTFISRYTKSTITGNARFDEWFGGTLNKGTISAIKKYLDPGKKTILYLPTHGNLSSFDDIAKIAPQIAKNFNLIIKPHHLTFYAEKEKVMQFQQAAEATGAKNIFWADDFHDLPYYLAVSDVVLSENSGAIFDALLADKPLVLLDIMSEDYLQKEIWKIKHDKDIWSLPQTYAGSIEQKIKKDPAFKIGEVIASVKEIQSAASKAIADAGSYSENRERLKKQFFSYCDGSAGLLAANELKNLIKSGRDDGKKTLLALESDAELLKAQLPLYENVEKLRKILRSYMNISMIYEPREESIGPVVFSVVVPTYNRGKSLEETLRSVLDQKNLEVEFELIVVDDGSDNDEPAKVVGRMIGEYPAARICYVKYKKNRGVSFARNIGILKSRGEYIAFTDDDCVVPEDWLANFKKDFDENLEIAGSGGWYIPKSIKENKKTSIWEKYLYWWQLPDILFWYKSVGTNRAISCGNTANVCYRKSALNAIGGFNLYFSGASTEDIELRTRMLKKGFVLLSIPRLVVHNKNFTFRQFVRDYSARSWSNHLIYRLHPEYRKNFSGSHVFFATLYDLEKIISSDFIGIKDKLLFTVPMLVRNACLALSKYWVALKILSDRDKRLK